MGFVLLTALVRFLEGMFAVGVVGSAVVLVLSGIEDIKTLFGADEDHS